MEKDLFELMTKMYGEMQTGFNNVNTRFDNLESRVGNLEIESKKTNMLIENEIKPSIEALFDGYKQNTEAITRLDSDVKDLTIAVNTLSIKTLNNENNIIAFSKKIDTMSNIKH
ncbi:MAG: hypothetical protein ACRC68_09455 [Clostridium sp.]